MKRVIIASVIGILASVGPAFGQVVILFDTYAGPAYYPVRWTSDPLRAPAGLAGTAVSDSAGFHCDLLWEFPAFPTPIGTTSGDAGLAVPTTTIPGAGSGWIQGPPVPIPGYQEGAITFTIQAWQGPSYANAVGSQQDAYGSMTWVEPSISGSTSYPGVFYFLGGPIIVSLPVPEPSTFALSGIVAAFFLVYRHPPGKKQAKA